MKFTEHRDSNILTVKQYRPGLVKINEFEIDSSCFLSQHELNSDWNCPSLDALDENHLKALFALKPDVIILGTGERQIFPDPSLFRFCAQNGIGLEVMDNAAACRTYNVLTTEDRNIVLGLIMAKPE
ncbi:MAG: Mth938-like domain-containing protein [Hydrogenovibrio sp.]